MHIYITFSQHSKEKLRIFFVIVKIRNFASPNPIGSLSCNIELCCFLLVHLFAAGYSLLPIGPALWYDFSHWSTIMLVHSYTYVLRSIQYIFIDSVSSCFSYFCTLAFFCKFCLYLIFVLLFWTEDAGFNLRSS
jgi:hypothetical protein